MTRSTDINHEFESRRFRTLQTLARHGGDWIDLIDLYQIVGTSGTGTSDHGKVLARLVAEGYAERRPGISAPGVPWCIRGPSARITPAGAKHFRAELARLQPAEEDFQW